MIQTYDIGLAWNWEFDRPFIHGVEHECQKLGLTTYHVHPNIVDEVTRKVRAGKLIFRTFLDRASDDDETFIPLAKLIAKSQTYVFNHYDRTEYAKDKANMHLALLGEGVWIPYTIIISPYNKKKEIELSLTELQHLGRPFIIKPANTTGGGVGVVIGAETLKQILESRQHHKNDTYLLQETVRPTNLEGRKAWFRVFYACGVTIACWWDHETHIYHEMSAADEKRFRLKKLHDIILIMQNICKLDFFSTEIALTEDGKFVAVDYINEICDMREQSTHYDGVPNSIVSKIQHAIALGVKSRSKKAA